MFFRTATIASLISQRYFSSKIALDINNHFQNTGQALCLDKFPNSFLTSTSIKDPKALYVANHIAANAIVDSIKCFHKENLVFFEVNPGSCILSELLIEHLKLKRLYLLESNDVFEEYQKVPNAFDIILDELIHSIFISFLRRNSSDPIRKRRIQNFLETLISYYLILKKRPGRMKLLVSYSVLYLGPVQSINSFRTWLIKMEYFQKGDWNYSF